VVSNSCPEAATAHTPHASNQLLLQSGAIQWHIGLHLHSACLRLGCTQLAQAGLHTAGSPPAPGVCLAVPRLLLHPSQRGCRTTTHCMSATAAVACVILTTSMHCCEQLSMQQYCPKLAVYVDRLIGWLDSVELFEGRLLLNVRPPDTPSQQHILLLLCFASYGPQRSWSNCVCRSEAVQLPHCQPTGHARCDLPGSHGAIECC
jgi:hypothetical protein